MSSEAPSGDGVDLHLHSLHSDGLLTPAQVVDRAAEAGVRLLALTDHDTVAGCDEARARCGASGIASVTGVELSASWRGQTIHVLGFDFDGHAASLQARLREVQELRRARLREIARRLERKHVAANELVARIEASHVVVTRTHLARALVEAGVARSLAEVFKRLLGRGTPGHVASDYPSLDSTVECLRGAGGFTALAHPLRYTFSAGARRQLLQEFRDAGGTALEVICGNARSQIEQLAQMAQRFGLDGSAGSDFHDPQLPWNPPGRLAKLPASVSPVWRHFRLPA
jgi:predicted metal-dependent phosphoesterase TrpH